MKNKIIFAIACALAAVDAQAAIFGDNGIVSNSVNRAVNAPGDILYGQDRPNRLLRRPYNSEPRVATRSDYSEEFMDMNPEL